MKPVMVLPAHLLYRFCIFRIYNHIEKRLARTSRVFKIGRDAYEAFQYRAKSTRSLTAFFKALLLYHKTGSWISQRLGIHVYGCGYGMRICVPLRHPIQLHSVIV